LSFGQIVRNFFPCRHCGRKGKRFRVEIKRTPHIALGRRAFIKSRTGVYKSRCDCQKFFASPIPGVPFGGKYSCEVRQVIADSIIRDRLPYRKVQDRLQEDFLLTVSVGYIHDCFQWAYEQINTEDRRQWAVANFSGVLCIDEVHDSGRVYLYATDPLNDFTIHFAVNDVNDQEHMDRFLQELRDMGILPDIVITDGSPLYKDALQERWKNVEHQLCLFHVFKDVNKLLLDGLRSVKNKIRRQGNKGRRKKRGRPSKMAQRNRANQKKESRKEQAAFLWEHQHLLVKKTDSFSGDDKENLRKMVSIAPEVKLLRQFNQEFYQLFEKGITKQKARYRRTKLVNRPEYQKNTYLTKAIKKIRKELFEKMIVFMDYGKDAQRTSNHVERNNRSFRMLQKTRYKRRKEKTITMAIELDLYAKMIFHPLFEPRSLITLAEYQNRRENAA
jgi:transposase-like protein